MEIIKGYGNGVPTTKAAEYVGVHPSTLRRNLEPLRDEEGNVIKKGNEYLFGSVDVELYRLWKEGKLSKDQYEEISRFGDVLSAEDFELMEREEVLTDKAAGYVSEATGVRKSTAKDRLTEWYNIGVQGRTPYKRTYKYQAPDLVRNARVVSRLQNVYDTLEVLRPWHLSEDKVEETLELLERYELLSALISPLNKERRSIRDELKRRLEEIDAKGILGIGGGWSVSNAPSVKRELNPDKLAQDLDEGELVERDILKRTVKGRKSSDILRAYLKQLIMEDAQGVSGQEGLGPEDLMNRWPERWEGASEELLPVYGMGDEEDMDRQAGNAAEAVAQLYEETTVGTPRFSSRLPPGTQDEEAETAEKLHKVRSYLEEHPDILDELLSQFEQRGE